MTEAQDFGPKPRLEWIACENMLVDPAYQRDTNSVRSQKLIESIGKDFRWARMQPLVVTPRGKFVFAVIDGQHRRAGAMLAGITELPCMVVPAGDIAAEADAFVRLNSARVSITPYHIHWSKVAAGDGEAVLIDAVCARAGISICRYPVDNRGIKPGQTLALDAIRRAIRSYEPPATIRALKAMAEAYAGRRGQLRAALILGVCDFVAGHDPDHGRLVSALKAHDAYDIEEAARAERRRTGGGGAHAIVSRMVAELYARAQAGEPPITHGQDAAGSEP
jgi:hypothetical protein